MAVPGEMAVDLLHFMFDAAHNLSLVMHLTPRVSLGLVQAFHQTLHVSAGDLRFNPFLMTEGHVKALQSKWNKVIIFGSNYLVS